MPLLKKLLLILTIWAYALQAVAGVSSLPCSTHESKVVVSAATNVAAMPGHHETTGMHHPAADAEMAGADEHHQAAVTAGSPDCDDCKCPPAGCKCSGHGCSSSPGVITTRSEGVDGGAAIAETRFTPSSLLPAFRQGLIRPPGIS